MTVFLNYLFLYNYGLWHTALSILSNFKCTIQSNYNPEQNIRGEYMQTDFSKIIIFFLIFSLHVSYTKNNPTNTSRIAPIYNINYRFDLKQITWRLNKMEVSLL